MPNLEPTYLRYIYDGLVKGSIHLENAAELPDGLIGLYEEAFNERTSVVERQKLLQRFAIWALLKKEVSTVFVAEVLGETEDAIQEFISTYSAWFNSPESGKYQLYHERLTVYLLQKLSEEEIHSLHEKIIERLEKAIEAQKADEFEWYGLEFLASHLSTAAMLNGDGKKLIELAYSQTHWQRQLKISKGYSWTNNGLKQVMTWASKYNDDEVIECGLQMVDLHHQEQNAAPQIVALVAEGDFESASFLIESFGLGNNIGEMRRCMLFIVLLTEGFLVKPDLHEKKRRFLLSIIEKFKVDFYRDTVHINDFVPSYVLFKLISKLNALGIEYSFLTDLIRLYDSYWYGLVQLTENETSILEKLELIGMEEGCYRQRKKTTIEDLNVDNLNRLHGANLSAFYNLHQNILLTDKAALQGDWKSALNYMLTALSVSKFFEPEHQGGKMYHHNRRRVIGACISNSEFLSEGKLENYLLISKYINDDNIGSISTISEKLFEQKMFTEMNSLLVKLKVHKDDYWFRSTMKRICLNILSRQNWKYSKELVLFIGDIVHFSFHDTMYYLGNIQTEVVLDPILFEKKSFFFSRRNKKDQIQDVHLKAVIAVNRFLSSESYDEKVFVVSKLKKYLMTVRVEKVKCLFDFFIENAANEIPDSLQIILNRIDGEKIEDKFKILNDLMEISIKHDRTELIDLFEIRIENENFKIRDTILKLRIKAKYFHALKLDVNELLEEFYEIEDELINSFDGRIGWNEVLFQLVDTLIGNNNTNWKTLISHQVKKRKKITKEHLSYLGDLSKVTHLLCELQDYESAYWLASEVPERHFVLLKIIDSYLKKGCYSEVFEIARKNFGDEYDKEISNLISNYIWNDKSVIMEEIKYFVSKMERDLQNDNILSISNNRIKHVIKLLNFNNINSIKLLLAKYTIDGILKNETDYAVFNHLNDSLDLSWFESLSERKSA
jgi:hypothetical protein